MIHQPPTPTLFPYTTLFRSASAASTGSSTETASSGRSRPRRCSTSRSRSEEHTSELQSRRDVVCRLLLEKKKDAGRNRAHQVPAVYNGLDADRRSLSDARTA